jgi:hypothetical protein
MVTKARWCSIAKAVEGLAIDEGSGERSLNSPPVETRGILSGCYYVA